MARVLTGDKMVESVRKRTMVPNDTASFTDDDILDIIDEEMNVQVIDKLLELHGENLTISVDVPRNESGSYDIPYRAVGNKLRDISLINGERIYELSQISIGELSDYTYGDTSFTNLDKFYVQNNKVQMVDQERAYEFVRIMYYLRPSFLTTSDKAGVVSSITDNGDGTTTIGMSSVGKNFVSGVEYDIVGLKSPNKIKAFDLSASALTTGDTGSITFTTSDISSIIADVNLGDFITLAQETPVPNIPTEMHPLLAQAAAIQILESLGDTEALGNAEKRMVKMTEAVQKLIDDRVELAPKKIKPRHGTLNAVLGNQRATRGRY